MSDRALVTPSTLEQARRLFFAEGRDPGTALAPHIGRSWRRCDALRPQHAAIHAVEPLAKHDLQQRRDAAAWLLQCAQPELDSLAEHALGQGCVVILSDASGLILDEIGSPEFLPKAQRVALTPGVDWSEAQRGTNAIGTALLEREALMVLGGEHFMAQNGALGCAAAPIFTPRGELAGVLDISGEAVHVNAHALGLVRMAAAQVEHRMMSARGGAAGRPGQLVRFHRRPGLLGTAREGLLSVVDGSIVGANRAALALLGTAWGELLGAPAERIFGARWPRLQDAPGLVAAPDGQHWAVVVDPGPRGAARPTRPVEVVQDHAAEPAIGHAAESVTDILAPLLARAARVADEGVPVLVTGETGSGKDVFVRRLHQASRRATGPLVAVNCAALPESLIEAELFGYEEGAFTGARRRGLPGRLREAHGGLLFLDEIGDMPLPLQTRLLRVLEERVVRPLGGTQGFEVDFQLVCATHHDLPALVAQGRFREDLLYRLMGYTVAIPPLRERADRRALIQQLFKDTGATAKALRLDPAALDALAHRPWPGNVRELLSTLRSLVALADPGTTLEVGDLPGPAAGPSLTAPPTVADAPVPGQASQAGLLAALTDGAIQQALAAHGGKVAPAARALGLHRSTLYRHLARQRGLA